MENKNIPVYGFINNDGMIYENTVFISKQRALSVYGTLDKGWYPIVAHVPFVHKYVFLVRFKRRLLHRNPFERYAQSNLDDISSSLNNEQADYFDSDSKSVDIFELYEIIQNIHKLGKLYLDADIPLYSNPFPSMMPIIDIGKPYSDISERFKISERIFPSKAYAKKFCGPDAYNPYSGITIEKLIVDKSNMINSIKNLI